MNSALEKTKSVVSQMYWWLSKKRSFYIGDDYRIDLIEVNKKNGNAKILITNLKHPGEKAYEPQEMFGL